VVVCTSCWLDGRVREHGPLVGRHHLVVEKVRLARVKLYLTDDEESQEADTWPDPAVKVGRVGKWEFEDYQPY
jgi:Immunity protein 8